jgi:hypothetical protein
MVAPQISFLTPYWSGAGMMRLHLESIRRFHPQAPVLISKRGDDGEIERLHREFNLRYWVEDCGYTTAYLRLLQRCDTRFACILDHDVVLLASIDPLIERLAAGQADLVGVEERIRVPDALALGADALAEAARGPWPGGWLRYAPGCMASNFLIFDWQAFDRRWGLRGVFGTPDPGAHHFDFDYGIAQRLRRHHYLRPYHADRYGLGNLLKDGDAALAWHQWYGSFRTRLEGEDPSVQAIASSGEDAFLRDYPNLDLSTISPAWGPQHDAPPPAAPPGLAERARRQAGYQWRALAARIVVALERSNRGAGPA